MTLIRKMVVVLGLLLFAASGWAQNAASAAANERGRLWFVELSGAPAIDGGSSAALRSEKQAFRTAARQAGIKFSERFAYDTLFNGLSVSVDPAQVPALARIDGVKNVWPVEIYSIPPTTSTSDPDLITALSMTGADIVQSQLGFTGKGVKVAIMDTGIDYNHPDLGGCFGEGCRVAYGTDLVGDAYDAGTNPIPVPDGDPMDCAGHGTHVAGIVGAHAASATGVTGVAPGVTFGAYRVFGCSGSTSADIMIRAMELAFADGMQVLNMSIGSSFTWPQYPTAVASNRLVNHGVVVVASFGNSGAAGLYSGGAPGVGEKVIGVASFDNVKYSGLPSFTVSPDDARFGYLPATGAPAAPIAGSAPMVRTGTPASTTDACNALPAGSLSGQIALIRRGTCQFYQKAMNAQNAGAVAVVLYNNATGMLSPTVAPTPPAPPVSIPVVAITASDGVILNGRIAAGPVTLTWTGDLGSATPGTGNLISSFSSYGLSPDLTLKPDIGAPGGYIYSTYPLAYGGYANLSGTSMASPHVAGAVALYLQAHPHASAQAVRSIFQNSASPKLWWGNPPLGLLDNVNRQGAGMLQIDKAVLATTFVTPGKLSLGESAGGPSVQTLTLDNNGPADVTYALSNEPALANGSNTFSPSFYAAFADVTFGADTVTVPAGGSATVTATIAAPAGPAKGMYGGYIAFTPADEAQTLRVPYAGFIGDYQSIQVLTPTTYGFPWIARLVGTSYFQEIAGASFNLSAGDYPYFLVHLNHPARAFQMEVFDSTGRAWHRAYNENYLPRNSGSTGFFAFGWDGITVIGSGHGAKGVLVPAGTYTVKISILKALGDEANPADWETWTSPAFSIVR